VVAVFVRIIILGEDIDIFEVTGLYDILFLTVHLVAILASGVKLNSENHNSSVWLEYQKFRYSMEIAQIKNETDRLVTVPSVTTEKMNALNLKLGLVKSAMSKIKRLDTPVTIFGLVIDQTLMLQLMGFVSVGAVSAFAQLVNNSRTN